jgi:hypothetical protein
MRGMGGVDQLKKKKKCLIFLIIIGHFLAYIIVEKSAQPGEGGGCTPTSFHYDYHHILYKVVVYAPAA